MKKRYILNGFPSKDDVQRRNHELALKSGIKEDATTKYLFRHHQLQKEEWGLEVPEDQVELLDETERTEQRLREIPHRPFIAPYVPILFRYLESEFVDQFFEDGSLRLSSFKRFHQHKDEQRLDKSEGSNMIMGEGNEQTLTSFMSHGHDAFVLSTSLLDDDSMFEDFKVESGIIIENPLQFIHDVANHVPEFKGANFGPCLYLREKIIRRKMEGLSLDQLRDDDNPENISISKMMAATNQASGNEPLFVKAAKYSPQHEFRILWHTFLDKMLDHIDIKIPEARKYCRKMENKNGG